MKRECQSIWPHEKFVHIYELVLWNWIMLKIIRWCSTEWNRTVVTLEFGIVFRKKLPCNVNILLLSWKFYNVCVLFFFMKNYILKNFEWTWCILWLGVKLNLFIYTWKTFLKIIFNNVYLVWLSWLFKIVNGLDHCFFAF